MLYESSSPYLDTVSNSSELESEPDWSPFLFLLRFLFFCFSLSFSFWSFSSSSFSFWFFSLELPPVNLSQRDRACSWYFTYRCYAIYLSRRSLRSVNSSLSSPSDPSGISFSIFWKIRSYTWFLNSTSASSSAFLGTVFRMTPLVFLLITSKSNSNYFTFSW